MKNQFGSVFSAGLALALLIIYAVSALNMVIDVLNDATPQMMQDKYKPGYIYVLTTVGGLVSALVVAKLSVTSPGNMPMLPGSAPESTWGRRANATVVSIYLLAWAMVGLSCLIVGVMVKPDVSSTVADIGTAWLGLAVSSAYVYFGIDMVEDSGGRRVAGVPELNTHKSALQAHIDNGKIIFDRDTLRAELLRENSGTKIAPNLQKLILHLADTVPSHIRISSLIRSGGKHGAGKAVDIGNEEVARDLLADIGLFISVLDIDEVIFDASVAGEMDRNEWNYDQGRKHDFATTTLDEHKDHVHFAVT